MTGVFPRASNLLKSFLQRSIMPKLGTKIQRYTIAKIGNKNSGEEMLISVSDLKLKLLDLEKSKEISQVSKTVSRLLHCGHFQIAEMEAWEQFLGAINGSL